MVGIDKHEKIVENRMLIADMRAPWIEGSVVSYASTPTYYALVVLHSHVNGIDSLLFVVVVVEYAVLFIE